MMGQQKKELKREIVVYFYKEGDRPKQVPIPVTVQLSHAQSQWANFLLDVGAALDIAEIEGVYEDVGGAPVIRIASLKDTAMYFARPTETCSLLRSLIISEREQYPAWPSVEEGREAKHALQLAIEEWGGLPEQAQDEAADKKSSNPEADASEGEEREEEEAWIWVVKVGRVCRIFPTREQALSSISSSAPGGTKKKKAGGGGDSSSGKAKDELQAHVLDGRAEVKTRKAIPNDKVLRVVHPRRGYTADRGALTRVVRRSSEVELTPLQRMAHATSARSTTDFLGVFLCEERYFINARGVHEEVAVHKATLRGLAALMLKDDDGEEEERSRRQEQEQGKGPGVGEGKEGKEEGKAESREGRIEERKENEEGKEGQQEGKQRSRREVLDKRGVGLLLHVVRKWQADRDICKYGCWAVNAYVQEVPEFQLDLLGAGGQEVLKGMLERHSDDGELHTYVISTLFAAVEREEAAQRAAIKLKLHENALAALRRWPDNAALCVYCCWLLTELCNPFAPPPPPGLSSAEEETTTAAAAGAEGGGRGGTGREPPLGRVGASAFLSELLRWGEALRMLHHNNEEARIAAEVLVDAAEVAAAGRHGKPGQEGQEGGDDRSSEQQKEGSLGRALCAADDVRRVVREGREMGSL